MPDQVEGTFPLLRVIARRAEKSGLSREICRDSPLLPLRFQEGIYPREILFVQIEWQAAIFDSSLKHHMSYAHCIGLELFRVPQLPMPRFDFFHLQDYHLHLNTYHRLRIGERFRGSLT